MRAHRRTLLTAAAALGLLGALAAAAPTEEGYSPVAPVPAVHAAVQSSLKTVRDWLDEKDYASAAQAAQGLKALGRLYVYQGTAANVEGGGTEAGRGRSALQENRGGDARFMGAQALGWMSDKIRAREDVLSALRTASKDQNETLRTEAEKVLHALEEKP